MHAKADDVVRFARECLGARYRIQGRHPATGLDCGGLGLYVLRRLGREPEDCEPYSLRTLDRNLIAGMLRSQRFEQLAPSLAEVGDYLLFEPASGLRHLAIKTDYGVVHAHLGLRKVVEAPPDPGMRLIEAWRLPDCE